MKRLLLLTLALVACDGESEPGRLNLGLDDGSPFFRLRIFEATPDSELSGKSLFDTGCIEQLSRTYELTNIPVGTGYAIVYEGFPRSPCSTSERAALGFRGAVTVSKAGEPYVHVQVYVSSAATALPEGINLSASAARAVDVCAVDGDCGASEICFDDAAPSFWCVPSCDQDTDCTGLHPRATCDTEAGWCMLRTPFPLNMSEGRVLGAAATLADGDVVLFGGLKQEGAVAQGPTASFETTTFPLERFDADTGLFAGVTLSGDVASPGGEFGFGELGGDRFVAVGGISRAQLGWTTNNGLVFDGNWSQDLLAQIIVWDLAAGTTRVSTLGQGQARAAIVPLDSDSFVAIGGIAPGASGVEVKKGTLLCDVGADLSVTCRGGPTLSTSRQAPATLCLDNACARILIVGGNSAGPLAEVLDLSTQSSTALTTKGLPEKLLGPVLCGFDLVAGSQDLIRANPTVAVRLSLEGDELEGNALAGTPATGYLPAVAPLSSAFGSGTQCHLAGGLSTAGFTGSVVRVGSSRFEEKATLSRPRFGARAALIGRGPLAGAMLVSGGLALPGTDTAPGNGPLVPVLGAEVYLP